MRSLPPKPASAVCALWLLLLVMLPSAGCRKQPRLNYRTAENLNALSTEPGQPVMLGLYQLSARPGGLVDQSCETLSSNDATVEFLGDALLPREDLVSLTPGAEDDVKLDRLDGAKWLLVVPYFEACDRSVTSWTLVRWRRGKRRFYLELNSYEISLPWERRLPEGRAWRQRGSVDGEGHHILWQVD
jgi:predicted component of type VI protein secretion system